MLVLVSFGLVLLATILLVVGLLSDDGLMLIYFSIAASFTAAVVLYLAFRMARPKSEPDTAAPSPLDDDIAPAAEVSTPPAATPTPTPTPTQQVPTAAPHTVEEPAPAAVTPEPAAAATATAVDDDWVDDEDWSNDEDWAASGDFEVEFPIADYDDLAVTEIMPLLPQLYSDELEIVAERERAGKNRSTILDRLDQLAETGTEADRLEQEAEDAAAEPEVAVAAGSPEPEPAPAIPDAPVVSLHDDGDDLEYVFPIADYDDLTVAQILPLLAQLELDELEEVKEREVAGQARKSLITEIDRYLSGELQVAEWDEETGEIVPGEAAAAPAAAPEPEPASAGLPIADYDQLNVADIRPQLSGLSDAELEAVLEHEVARDNRKTIVDDIERRLAGAPAAAAASTTTSTRKKATATKKATKKRAARRSKKPTAKKTAGKKVAGKKAAGKKTAGKKAAGKKRSTKKKASANNRFPIANYDELTVAEIRPRLTDLSDGQLQQVRERELTGAGRKTILKDIDNRLS